MPTDAPTLPSHFEHLKLVPSDLDASELGAALGLVLMLLALPLTLPFTLALALFGAWG